MVHGTLRRLIKDNQTVIAMMSNIDESGTELPLCLEIKAAKQVFCRSYSE